MKTEILIAKQKVTEQALLVSEQRYDSLLAATNDYVYTVTVEHGRSVATSHGPGCEVITGFTSGEFDQNPSLWYRMVHDEDRPAVLAQVARILKGEAPFPLEHRIIHKNGNTRWIRNVPVPKRDALGQLLSYNGLISDITDRKRTEQLLAVQYAVTRELAKAGTLREAFRPILKAICDSFPWDWAAFWRYNTDKNILEWSGLWHSPSNQFEEFAEANNPLHFESDVSLPAQAWASGEPAWIPDVVRNRHFLRASVAARVGLFGACAMPISRGEERVGIIELLSRKIQPRDSHMIEMLKAVGTQISQFLDRKWAEEALTTERNLLRTLIDSLPDYVFAKDRQGRFLMNNLAHLNVLGAAQSREVVGKTDLDFFPRELAELYSQDDQAVFASGKALFNREEPVMHPAGNRQWVLTSKVPWKDSRGEIIGLIGVSRDITERNRAAEKQRLSEARLQAIVDNSPAVIYLKDIEGRYLLVNGRFEALFHSKREEAVGRTDHELFPRELADNFRANDLKVVASLAPMEFEEVTQEDDGVHTYISVKFPLITASGSAYAVCGISTDISERKRAEDQLRGAYTEMAQNEAILKRTVEELRATHEELKTTELQLIQAVKLECIGTLAAGVAHEVKNPLQTILMGLHYLTKNVPANNGGTTIALQDMREAVTRANSIISGLLELSAETKFKKKAEDLNACIERSLWLLRHEFVAAQTTVVRQFGADSPVLLLDRGKMEQVFINLFINALHAMPHGGTVTVTTRVEHLSGEPASHKPIFRQFGTGDTLAVIELQDTGTGIPESLLPKVFDAFFTTKSAGHGTGLGLAVVKKIVALHGGAIDIQNAPPGGVLVTLILKM